MSAESVFFVDCVHFEREDTAAATTATDSEEGSHRRYSRGYVACPGGIWTAALRAPGIQYLTPYSPSCCGATFLERCHLPSLRWTPKDPTTSSRARLSCCQVPKDFPAWDSDPPRIRCPDPRTPCRRSQEAPILTLEALMHTHEAPIQTHKALVQTFEARGQTF